MGGRAYRKDGEDIHDKEFISQGETILRILGVVDQQVD